MKKEGFMYSEAKFNEKHLGGFAGPAVECFTKGMIVYNKNIIPQALLRMTLTKKYTAQKNKSTGLCKVNFQLTQLYVIQLLRGEMKF